MKFWTKKRFEELARRPNNEELRVPELHGCAAEAESFCRVTWLAVRFYIAMHPEPKICAWSAVHRSTAVCPIDFEILK